MRSSPGTRVKFICPQCSTTLNLQPHAAKSRRFCSAQCSNQWKIGNTGGPTDWRFIDIDRDLLYRMYVDEKKTSTEIGHFLGVDPSVVRRRMNRHGIPRRPAGTGLASRGTVKPTADELSGMVYAERLTMREIGEKFGVDKSAVAYWMKGYDLRIPSCWESRRRKIEGFRYPTESELRKLYLDGGLPTNEIGDMFNTGGNSILKLLHEFNIPTRSAGFGQQYVARDGQVVKSSYELRVANWLAHYGLSYQYEPAIPKQTRLRSDFLVGDTYIEVWGMECEPAYKRRQMRKLALYRSHLLPLIELRPMDFNGSFKWRDDLADRLLKRN